MVISRLKQRTDFLRIAKGGRKYVAPSFVMQSMPAPEHVQNEIRIGFTVTKKLGNAVKRNRIKRRLKEASRLTFPDNASSGYDYVIIGRKAALDKNFNEITADMIKALSYLEKGFAIQNKKDKKNTDK